MDPVVMEGHMSSGPSVCIPMDVSIKLERVRREGGIKGMKTCSSYEFHSLEGNLGIRGCIYMGLERARHIRGLVCSVTTLLSVLSLLNQVVGLSLDQILALVDAVV